MEYLAQVFTTLRLPTEIKESIKTLCNQTQAKTAQRIKKLCNQPSWSLKIRHTSNSPRRTVSTKHMRDYENQAFRHKVASTQQLIRKLSQERAARSQREAARLNNRLAALQDIERAEAEEQAIVELAKVQSLKRMLSEKRMSRLRHQEEIQALIRLGKDQSKAVAESVPLFKRIEAKFQENVILKDLERRKAALAKKRELFRSVPRHEMQEHARKHHESLHRRQPILKSPNFTPPRRSALWTHLQEAELLAVQQQAEEAARKKALFEKQQKYSQLVKAVYVPRPSLVKQMQVKAVIERLQNPAPKYVPKGLKPARRSPKPESKLELKLTPVPETRKIDYLQEFRKTKRGQSVQNWTEIARSEVSAEEREAKLKKLAGQIELKAAAEDAKIGTTLNSYLNEKASNLYIDSIKAKLAVFQAR